jgi:predicted DNA-binding transcriptional regulator AlpA
MDSEKMMTQKNVMDLLQIFRTILHRLRKEDVIPKYKVGKQGVRFKRSEIKEYVNHQKQGA